VRRAGGRLVGDREGSKAQIHPVSEWRIDLEAFELVLLRRPADARSYDEATLAQIQSEHIAYHASLREAGRVVTNGPVRDQLDESLRGLTFYRTGSLDEARRLAEEDPAVRAGRLAVEVMAWYCPAGTMVHPGTRVGEPV
jgi:uncharacterized protein